MGEVGLLMGKCGAPGRRARFEGISGLAALALEMPQDSINHACISNNGDNLHLSAAGTQHRFQAQADSLSPPQLTGKGAPTGSVVQFSAYSVRGLYLNQMSELS